LTKGKKYDKVQCIKHITIILEVSMNSTNFKTDKLSNKKFIAVSECIIEIIFCFIFYVVLSGNFKFIGNLFNDSNVVVKIINLKEFANYNLMITIIAIVGIVNALIKIKERRYNKLVLVSETITFLGSLIVLVNIINSKTITGVSYHIVRLIVILIMLVEYFPIAKKIQKFLMAV